MMPSTPPLHYLALGDSYTIGESVGADQRWPAQLVQRLRREGVVIDDPRIVATTGWTTDELAQGMDAAHLDASVNATPEHRPFDVVTLQIGVNNQYRGRSAGDYRLQFSDLLKTAIALAGGRGSRVLVVSIPDWGVTPFARKQGRDAAQIARELDTFNAIARDETVRCGARFIDITGISRRHPDLIAADGLHPSAAQYVLWTELVLPVARAALRPH